MYVPCGVDSTSREFGIERGCLRCLLARVDISKRSYFAGVDFGSTLLFCPVLGVVQEASDPLLHRTLLFGRVVRPGRQALMQVSETVLHWPWLHSTARIS